MKEKETEQNCTENKPAKGGKNNCARHRDDVPERRI